MIKAVRLLVLPFFISACSRDYQPADHANGEQIYLEACSQCHRTAANASIFQLHAKNTNANYISEKVLHGSAFMPSFPNITGNNLVLISDYVLEHSEIADE
ncbi:cytochrome c [Methylomonas paludis]|uniref:Cytochrome c n=1 Tax=Methylomonas paludis TaxID=1173101 RepID=A0A975MM47_9GAMM|nr:cytochrome c [Methylomonas paludis]QWF70345.1 cytochrome c [Methylomonas paludis]